MKERIISLASSITGPLTAGFSLESINTVIDKTTPLITFFGLVFGTLLSFVMFCYWIRKLFKKDKK